MPEQTILERLKQIIKAVESGSPPLVIKMMTAKLSLALCDNYTNPLPAEVWDYFKTIHPAAQRFVIGAFCYGLPMSMIELEGEEKITPKPTPSFDAAPKMPIFNIKRPAEGK